MTRKMTKNIATLVLSLGCAAVLGGSGQAQQAVPVIPFDSVPNAIRMPPNMYLGEAAGVAVNSKGHVFVFSRGNSAHGPAYGASAAQLFEFDADGKYVHEIGKDLYAWPFAHVVRVDRHDNIGASARAPAMHCRCNRQGQATLEFGRRQ